LVLQDGAGVTIVQAEGETIDISFYSRNATAAFEEVAAPQCTILFTF
jgi:hypothetical protein